MSSLTIVSMTKACFAGPSPAPTSALSPVPATQPPEVLATIPDTLPVASPPFIIVAIQDDNEQNGEEAAVQA